jgi:hypothetical protein
LSAGKHINMAAASARTSARGSARRGAGGPPHWVCALLAATGGCVIPLAPEFESPETNYPPFIYSATPAIGAELTFGGTALTPGTSAEASREIRVEIGDPNLGDTLYVRWIYDYPPYDEESTRLVEYPEVAPSNGGTGFVRLPAIRFTPSCAKHSIARGTSQHRLTLAVADRAFITPEQAQADFRLDDIKEGYPVRATWILNNLECR